MDNGVYLAQCFTGEVQRVMMDTADPLKTADNLQQAIAECEELHPKQIVVDITTFTRESLLILFKLLLPYARNSQVLFLYAPAKEYSVGEEPENKWLSRGVADVRSVLGYPGELLPTRKEHLIVLVGGFEHDRAAELIGRREPSVISLGYSRSDVPSRAKHQAETEQSFEMVRAIYRDAHEFTFHCHEPYKTRDAILQQREVAPDHNVIVSPFNTKISTIGAAMAASQDMSIQLCYAEAELYNSRNYSVPGDTFCLFGLNEI